MALVRVYCGLAADDVTPQPGVAGPAVTVALVDDAGRVLDLCEIEDHPKGYAYLSALLAERASGPYSVAIAADSDQHLVVKLLAAAGWALAFPDAATTDPYAERFTTDFSHDPVAAPRQRRAQGLARALHAGAITAVTMPAPAGLADLKPMLAADGALANGRYGAAVALREVLRELYPAALRAYADPADPVALAVMDALPEPGTLTATAGGRGPAAAAAAQAVTAELAATGVADPATITQAITALRDAVTETPRREGLTRSMAAAVAETVRNSVAAVRAYDEARNALMDTLTERVLPGAASAAGTEASSTGAGMSVPAARRDEPWWIETSHTENREPAATPAGSWQRDSWLTDSRPTDSRQNGTRHSEPLHDEPRHSRPVSSPASTRPVSSPPPPGITPIATPRVPLRHQRPSGGRQAAAGVPVDEYDRTGAEVRVPVPRPAPEGPPPGSRADWPTSPPPGDWAAPVSTAAAHGPSAPLPAFAAPPQPAPVTPPWQANDLRQPEPPALRLVEPTLPEELRNDVSYQGGPDTPPLRLVDSDEGIPRSAPPVDFNNSDDDLLIFAQARSAWFSDPTEDTKWSSSVDAGWRAAEHALQPAVGDHTSSGLPRRVPHANLIPGSAPSEKERQLRVVRDPARIAAHTSGYFNGWRRGQEVGGYPLGTRTQRPGAGAWDFARDHHAS